MSQLNAKDILNFWFVEIESKQRWKKDAAFDALIVERFSSIHLSASQCELFAWRETAQGRLAEIIILDQFSRNMFRNTAKAFAQDALALALSQQAVSLEIDSELTDEQKSFLYMPYMHSESKLIHREAERLFQVLDSYDFELRHKAIIDRFGRYPHRNTILGRESTLEELEFLSRPGSSF